MHPLKKQIKIKRLLIVFLFFVPSQSFQQTITERDEYNAFISFVDKKTVAKEIKNIKAMSLVPISLGVKDNIDIEGIPNTAGSIALQNNKPKKSAYLAKHLKSGGYYVVGKTNLSEWANFRSTHSVSGWSSLGGQTVNPYGVNRNPCGSSSGSAVAVATGLVSVAIGTETNGSISCPASVNGVVGIKPTVGLVSRSGIIPISHSQDTAGPMGTNVKDAARLLSYMAGFDPGDPATAKIPKNMRLNFSTNLSKTNLKGKTIGLISASSNEPEENRLIIKAKTILIAAGARVIMLAAKQDYPGEEEYFVLLYEFREGINKYLSTHPNQPKNLKELIDFNIKNKNTVLTHFDQDIFLLSEQTKGQKEKYLNALKITKSVSTEHIDSLLNKNGLDAIVGLTMGPAWEIDYEGGDQAAAKNQLSWGVGGYAAMAGYPHITIPLGFVQGLPVGLSFISTAWQDKNIIEMAYAFEQANNL
jgi:Asp-tRNA(Asn)/Glu-tRNA(Gln) amidotransferase A subunit family amidase